MNRELNIVDILRDGICGQTDTKSFMRSYCETHDTCRTCPLDKENGAYINSMDGIQAFIKAHHISIVRDDKA